MINIKEITKSADQPFQVLKKFYQDALDGGQQSIEAIVISSIGPGNKYSDARFVNLKYITNDGLIFFSNYESEKASHFNEHKNAMITAVFYWNVIDVQIRIRGPIEKCKENFSDKHFIKRDKNKNALAISSKQSKIADNYDSIVSNYEYIFNNKNLSIRPKYWGGYIIKPSYFEFWEGNTSRINKRKVFEKTDDKWNNYFLQP